MARLYYMSLEGVGRWDRALTDASSQLKPYFSYISISKKAAEARKPILSWRPCLKREQEALEKRANSRYEERLCKARQGKNRRERREPERPPKGVWIVLEPPPWRPEEPEDTFDAFFDAREVYDRPPAKGVQGLKILSWDREAKALLLPDQPTVAEADEDAPEPLEGQHPWVGRLICLKPNTWNLECQAQALRTLESRPPPRLAPLTRLLCSQPYWPLPKPETIHADWIFLKDSRRSGTDEQRRFVELALGSEDFAILEGPPGSGKTTAICELIAQLAQQGKRVMLVASTHVAVDNVLERLLEWQEQSIEKLILPIRIGEEDKVSNDSLRDWTLNRLKQTWRDEITDFLEDPQHVDPDGDAARSILRESLGKSKEEDSPLIRLLLESANLICGTTIGILQHPAIKAARQIPPEPFDVMILDEASKTPFAEFLVPAIYARKWIIVGDVRQLSPYVEEEDLAENLHGLLPEELAAPTTAAFLAAPRNQIFDLPEGLVPAEKRLSQSCPVLYGPAAPSALQWLQQECEARGVRFLDLTECDPKKVILELLYADLICGSPDSIRRFERRLPGELMPVGALPSLPNWEAHHAAVADEEEEESWAHALAWRLIRSFELRLDETERKGYLAEIEGLLPASLEMQEREQLRRAIDTTRRVTMPSILELLQRGFERLPGKESFGVALTDGLPPQALALRLVYLTYQHRMHPDISRFPREAFYTPKLTPLEQEILNEWEEGAKQLWEQWKEGPFPGVLLSTYKQFSMNTYWQVPMLAAQLDPEGQVEQILRRRAQSLLLDAQGMAQARAWSYPRYPSSRSVWLNVQPQRKSYGNKNHAESERVKEELKVFVGWAEQNRKQAHDGKKIPWEVAVLTFYRGQEAILRKWLEDVSGLDGNTRNFSFKDEAVHVTLYTVDRFQGHEADVVFLSFVKSGSVGFLNSPNRLNVALTRARYQLVLFGHQHFFSDKRCRSPLLRALATSSFYPTDLTWQKKP